MPAASHRLPSSMTKMYAQVVPELASLLDHMERKDPILVISTTDMRMDSVLPFQLPPKYGCVVMGFFVVESVEVGSVLFFFEYSPVSETLFGEVVRERKSFSSAKHPTWDAFMEGATSIRVPIGCQGWEWKFSASLVVASPTYINDTRSFPLGISSGTREG